MTKLTQNQVILNCLSATNFLMPMKTAMRINPNLSFEHLRGHLKDFGLDEQKIEHSKKYITRPESIHISNIPPSFTSMYGLLDYCLKNSTDKKIEYKR